MPRHDLEDGMVGGNAVGCVRDRWVNIWWIQERLHDVDVGDLGRVAAEPTKAEAMSYMQDTRWSTR